MNRQNGTHVSWARSATRPPAELFRFVSLVGVFAARAELPFVVVVVAFALPLEGDAVPSLALAAPIRASVTAAEVDASPYGDASTAARRGRPALVELLLLAFIDASAARFEAAVARPPLLGVEAAIGCTMQLQP